MLFLQLIVGFSGSAGGKGGDGTAHAGQGARSSCGSVRHPVLRAQSESISRGPGINTYRTRTARWLHRLRGVAKKFVGREGLKSRKLHGQAGCVDDEAIADALRKVRETIAKYDPECIVNCDETALQYKMLPRSTYTAPDEEKSSVRGVKGRGAKERVTLYVATDASGRKLPLEMIGHSKGPRCFRVRKPPSSTSARPTRGLTRASSACGGRMCFFREYVQSPANPFSSSWTTTAATPTWSTPVGR